MRGSFLDPSPKLIAVIDAVRVACQVTRAVQKELCAGDVLRKDDRSPVTVADYAAQAVIARRLAQLEPGCVLVGEESADLLRTDAQSELRRVLVQRLRPVWPEVTEDEALATIDTGGQEPARKFWTLDPIDGTKGFLRNGQYAISLALIEDGAVQFGVLGCPNLSADWARPFDDPDPQGLIVYAVRDQGCWSLSADTGNARPQRMHYATPADTRLRLCESAESGHSDRNAAAGVIRTLGGAYALRLDSQAKYAIVARGQADAYMRIPVRGDAREYIWDHAPGAIIAEEAGACVTDIHGRAFDFSAGRTLARNHGILCASQAWHGHMTAAISAVMAARDRR